MAQSLFPGRSQPDPEEIKFRAVCALGWAIGRNLAELDSITKFAGQGWRMLDWIDLLEKDVIAQLYADSEDADTWQTALSDLVLQLSKRLDVKKRRGSGRFLNAVLTDLANPAALDPATQFAAVNRRAFDLATGMITDPQWSSPGASRRWTRESLQPFPIRFAADEAFSGAWVPETRNGEILIKVRSQQFVLKDCLLQYLNLEFELMHEYVSHVLPVWKSVGLRQEDEFLLAVMYLHYCDTAPEHWRPYLVECAEQRSDDYRRDNRWHIRNRLTSLVTNERLSQILTELAVLSEGDMPAARKNNLLVRFLEDLPPVDKDLRLAIKGWMGSLDVPDLWARLRRAMPHL